MGDYRRPQEGFRFEWGGVNTKETADALEQGKYSAASNIRATAEKSIRTRPGYESLFSCNNGITDIRAYTNLNNNSFPRFIARSQNGGVFLDTGALVGNLSGNAGYGAMLLPFRPRESAVPWMYVAGVADYQRFSAPDANNNVTQAKVGIAEPQNQVEAAPTYFGFFPFTAGFGNWNAGGTASGMSAGNRLDDVSGNCFQDPALSTRYYVQVGNNANAAYQQFMHVTVGNSSLPVLDVYPALVGSNGATSLTIQAIRYESGSNGNCVIVPGKVPLESSVIASLKRGSLINLGNETVLVRGLIPGPNGQLAIQSSTNNTASAGTVIRGVPSIALDGAGATISPGANINEFFISANIATGIGYVTQNFASNSNPFTTGLIGTSVFPNEDDLIHLSVNFSDPSSLIELDVIFNVDANSNNYAGDILYYAVRPGDLVNVSSGTGSTLATILSAAESEIIGNLPTPDGIAPPAQSAAGNNQWAEVTFPISALTRIGNNTSKTLADCVGVRLQVNAANNMSFRWGGLWVGGGGSPDVGNNGADYKYLCVPLASATGVRGNPTPLMTYGVPARRQPVIVKTSALNNSYDAQIDTWEVYRFGGTIDSYRFIGATPTGADFTDDYFDDTATAGDAVVIDNTEPWPSIDQPWRVSAGGGNSISAVGNILVVAGNNAAVFPSTITRWLPGTLFQISGNDAYTLRARPTAQNNTTYLFQFEECIGSGNQSSLFVLEPNVARQPLPYVWGPNEEGYVFGCGDPLRPGAVSFSKGNTPDAVPTAFNLEICPPSEPLLGGEVIRGVSMVASSKRWWYLNFQSGNERQLYIPVEAAVGKILAAPYGHTTDGVSIYFWAEDCIAETEGGPAQSLTDADIYNLFPHAGVAGVDVTTNGVTYYAPDYTKVAQFRMAFRSGLLMAFYKDTNGNARVLVYDKLRKAWSTDIYADPITVGYSTEQPRSTFQGAQNLYPGIVLGDSNGNVWRVKDLTNDGNTPISGLIATREYNAQDARTNDYWGDIFLDVIAPFGMNATPITGGAAVANTTTIPGNANRQFVPVSVGGETLQSFLGIRCSWTDDFRSIPTPTRLNVWQPSYTDKPEIIEDRFGDWMDFGAASYIRGLTIYADTFGNNKGMLIRNADNNETYEMKGGPAAGVINHNGEQTISYWFDPPFVSHMVREEPQDLVPWRKFKFEYIKDQWPELTDLPSPWMNVRDTGQAGFLQGLVLPLEVGANNNNVAPNLKLRVDSSANLITLSPTVDPMFNVKTGVPYSLDTPVVCHQVQIIPQEPCRVWWPEIEWKVQATPELAKTWVTQWTSLGVKGYKHIPRIEAAYAATAQVTLTIESFDGQSPTVITLGSTNGVERRFLITTTFNKGQLYRFSAISSDTFQIFNEDFIVWVCEWGRQGPAVPFHLGATFGDQAPI